MTIGDLFRWIGMLPLNVAGPLLAASFAAVALAYLLPRAVQDWRGRRNAKAQRAREARDARLQREIRAERYERRCRGWLAAAPHLVARELEGIETATLLASDDLEEADQC